MKGVKVLKFFLGFFILAGVLQLFFHFFILRAGITSLKIEGITGSAFTESSLLDNLKSDSPVSGSTSEFILIFEWGTVFIIVFFLTIKRKVEDKKEFESLNLGKQKAEKSWTNTDLDNLYEVLKERKNLKLSTISKAYSVDRDIVMAWGRALETANLIRVEYPFFGDPKFVFIEKSGV